MTLAQSETLPDWVKTFFNSAYAAADMPWSLEKRRHISKALVELLELKEGASVLDQCCGEGHLALAIARHNMRVYGVDQSASYIETARSMIKEEDAHFVMADAAHWAPPQGVDAAINWHTSLGYGGLVGATRLLQALRAPVKPNGLWLLELRNLTHYRDHHPLHFTEPAHTPQWGDVSVERTSRWDQDDLVQDWKIVKGSDIVWEQNNTRCFHPSQEKILSLIEQMGDVCVGIFANVDRAPLQDSEPRMVVLARKSSK